MSNLSPKIQREPVRGSVIVVIVGNELLCMYCRRDFLLRLMRKMREACSSCTFEVLICTSTTVPNLTWSPFDDTYPRAWLL